MMNQLLKTIDITRNRESLEAVISKVEANIYIVGINSDFFTAKENRETYNEIKNLKIMYSIVRLIHMGTMPLIEHEQLDNLLEVVFKKKTDENNKIWRKSLANGEGINKVLDIIEDKIKQQEKIAIVVSARQMQQQMSRRYSYYCCQNGNYKPLLESFKPIKRRF
jgi:hypothetical protein